MSDEGFVYPYAAREVIAQWAMPEELRQLCGADDEIQFRLLTVPGHRLGFVAEYAVQSDGMGDVVWGPLNSPAFAQDSRIPIMLHCAGIAIQQLTSERSDMSAEIISQKLYIAALEQELSTLNAQVGEKPAPKQVWKKPSAKKRKF